MYGRQKEKTVSLFLVRLKPIRGVQPLRTTCNNKSHPGSSSASKDTKQTGMYSTPLNLTKLKSRNVFSSFSFPATASIGYTIKAPEGSRVHLPCHFPPSSLPVRANAVWYKETGAGMRSQLTLEDDSTDENKKLELLYPLDQDQTIILRNIVMEDAGIYQCETTEGEKLSTVYIFVEGIPFVKVSMSTSCFNHLFNFLLAPISTPHMCEGLATAWEPCQDENSRTGEPTLQESIAEFSIKLYSYFREIYPSNNMLFSPVSINGLLSHLLLGRKRKPSSSSLCS